MYIIPYVRTVVKQLEIPNRSRISKDQLYEIIIKESDYILKNIDPQLF